MAKTVFTTNPDGAKLELATCRTAQDEANFVIDRVSDGIQSDQQRMIYCAPQTRSGLSSPDLA